ncbi:MAG: ABC transporter permease [Clostridiales bacterium]|jgi:simple sugar transport system permease protein|nr:ABC transporter permease [Clostridiales bacterium]
MNDGVWRKFNKMTKSGRLLFPLVCLFLVLIMNLIVTPDFFSVKIMDIGGEPHLYGRVIDILNRASELIILATAMTIVVSCSAGTDISVGAVMAFSGAVSVWFLGYGVLGVNGKFSVFEYQIPYAVGIMTALAIGSLCGVFNGFLVSRLKIQPMVATLILYTGGRGAAQLFAGGQIDRVEVLSYKWLGNFIPGIPVPTSIFLAAAVVAITAVVLRYTALGIFIQSVGINNKASRIMGLRSSRIVLLAYTFCGLCAAIAGLIATSRIGAIDANNCGRNIELDAILAVALGGNSLSGGKFSLGGSVIGAITIQSLTTSLLAMNVTADQLPVYKAIAVIIIVALQSAELKPLINRNLARLTGKAVVK